MTSVAGSQAVDPSGRWASRTRTQPGRVAMTGSTDGRSYQLAGTSPLASWPGAAYLGAVFSTVASSVLSGTAGRLTGRVTGGTYGRSLAACRAGAGAGGWLLASAVTPPDESTRPIEVASVATATMATAPAAPDAGNSRYASAVLMRLGGTDGSPLTLRLGSIT